MHLVITRLKRYGFSLTQIKALLEGKNAPQQQLQALWNQYEKLGEEIALRNALRTEMRQYIADYERTGLLMTHNQTDSIQEATIEALPVFYLRKTISMDEMNQMYSRLFEEAGRRGIVPSGPVGAMYHDESQFDHDHADTSVFFVCDPAQANQTIPGGKIVKCLHRGPYSTLGESYAALVNYIQAHSLDITAAPFELYLRGPIHNVPMEAWETEICFPVK